MRNLNRTLLVAALLVAPAAFAQNVDSVVAGVMKAYGGEASWKKVMSLRESGSVVAIMRNTTGTMTRTWQKPDKLKVEIVYPTKTEVRILDGDKGSQDGKDVTGMAVDAMRLQAARLALPYLLVEMKASLHDLGTRDALRIIEIPISVSSSVTVEIDPKTSHIVRSTGKAKSDMGAVEFITDYKDFRTVDGLLFAFGESNTAQGMRTADMTMTKIEVNVR